MLEPVIQGFFVMTTYHVSECSYKNLLLSCKKYQKLGFFKMVFVLRKGLNNFCLRWKGSFLSNWNTSAFKRREENITVVSEFLWELISMFVSYLLSRELLLKKIGKSSPKIFESFQKNLHDGPNIFDKFFFNIPRNDWWIVRMELFWELRQHQSGDCNDGCQCVRCCWQCSSLLGISLYGEATK